MDYFLPKATSIFQHPGILARKDHLSGLYSYSESPITGMNTKTAPKRICQVSPQLPSQQPDYIIVCRIAIGWMSVNYTCHSTPTHLHVRVQNKLQCIRKSFCSPVWKLYFCNASKQCEYLHAGMDHLSHNCFTIFPAAPFHYLAFKRPPGILVHTNSVRGEKNCW